MRDNFPKSVIETLAKRVNFRCSNPDCRLSTGGPEQHGPKSVSIGVASHISAASRGGPRHDETLTTVERTDAANGIWLCENCAKLIDADVKAYPPALLLEWRAFAEAAAALEMRGYQVTPSLEGLMRQLESEMPELFGEMREDFRKHPFKREFILLGRNWQYNSDGPYISYHYEAHGDLRDKVRLLENNGLVTDVTSTNVPRYRLSEEFARYLKEEVSLSAITPAA